MEKQSFGSKVALLRKKKGLTQLELAQQLGVTDKAVSKWERDLSFPDVALLPQLAEFFDVTVDELMQGKTLPPKSGAPWDMLPLALKAVALAMGIAVVVLSAFGALKLPEAVTLLAIGQICLSLLYFLNGKK